MHPTENEIRTHSYFLWEQAGCPEGHSLDYWLRAEAELKAVETRAKPKAPRRAARAARPSERGLQVAAFETAHEAAKNPGNAKR